MLARIAGVVGTGSHRIERLRREHETFALTGQPIADEFFRAADGLERSANRIHVGDIKEIDAGFVRRVHDRERFGGFGLQAEGHRAKTDFGYF